MKTNRLVIYTLDSHTTFNRMVKKYQEANPKVKIELTNFGQDVQKYREAVTGDNRPDIYMETSFPDRIAAAMQQGELADLSLFFAADETYDPADYNQLRFADA
ncbi:MAG TPA: extracellular solute-binding protein [Clostridiales bacterium]|nr:extracellular solute-binding protein [Clostridiales bacterium]